MLEAIKAGNDDLRKEMRDGFAAAAERHNELMQRVGKLEQGKQE